MANIDDLELMIIGLLTLGPKTFGQIVDTWETPDPASVSVALDRLRAKEQIVLLDGDRWALIYPAR